MTEEIIINLIGNDQASHAINQVKNSVESLDTRVQNSKIDRLKGVFDSVGAKALSLGSSLVSLVGSINSLGDAEDRVSKATLSLEKSKLALEKAQEKVNKMVSDGMVGTEEYEVALEELRLKEEQVKLKEDDLSDAIRDKNMMYSTFITSIAPNLVSAIAMNTSGIASLITATKTFHLASIMAFITNPITLAIMGIATVVALLAFNIGGLRDKVVEIIKAFLDWFTALTPIKALIEGLSGIAKGLGIELPTMEMPVEPKIEEISLPKLETTLPVSDTIILPDINQIPTEQFVTPLNVTEIDILSKSVDELNENMKKLKDAVDKLRVEIKNLDRGERERESKPRKKKEIVDTTAVRLRSVTATRSIIEML